MEDQTTLNSVPPFGEYTWNEVTTNNGTSAIVITTRVSSELPYERRNITVTLGAKTQQRVFSIPTESIEFEFEHDASKPTDYPLLITFLLYSPAVSNISVATNTLQGRVITTAETTTKPILINKGNEQVLCNAIFIIFIAVLGLF